MIRLALRPVATVAFPARVLTVLIAWALVLPPAVAQAGNLDAAARREVVLQLADLLNQRYVFADVGQKTAEYLRAGLAAGDFGRAATTADLARLLTQQLQAQTKDKHLQVMATDAAHGGPFGSPRAMQQSNYGFERLQRLPGNIGYLDLRFFMDGSAAADVAIASMNWLANSDALIVDLRRNGGGEPEMIRFIQSYLFDAPTLLNTLHWRDDSVRGGYRIEEFRTSEEVPGRRYGQKKPVWVLTSDFTFSGGEEFAYNLQALKRGTVIGQTTGGGAHPGDLFPLGHGMSVHLSTGRAVNPLTKANWEGTGVTPDIVVPADQALRRAQIEILIPMIAAEADPARRRALEARSLALKDGKPEY
ncbi:MAG TPA: S41 family peptidase [Burkholderiaceae bacterium]|nr:S41 family peptidase [Burkholderiaceae bacterium]